MYKYLKGFLILLILFSASVSISEKNIKQNYGNTWEETCEDGICTQVIYQDLMYVFEDDQWKKKEDAKSLFNYYSVDYLNNTENLEVIDFNYTSITIKALDSSHKEKSLKFKKKDKEDKNKTKEDKDLGVLDENVILVVEVYPFDDILVFGENSTEVVLNEVSVNEDTYTSKNQPTNNYGSLIYFLVGGGTQVYNGFMEWDMSSIPRFATILDAHLNLTVYSRYPSGSNTEVTIYKCENTTWFEGDSSGCDKPNEICWNNNYTIIDTCDNEYEEKQTMTLNPYQVAAFNLTNSTQEVIKRENRVITYFFECTAYTSSYSYVGFYSKTGGYKPNFVVVYDENNYPSITNLLATPARALVNTVVNMSASITEGLNTTFINVFYPNKTLYKQLSVSNESGVYYNGGETFTYPYGDYIFSFFANTSSGTYNESNSTFASYIHLEKISNVKINGSFEEWLDVTKVADEVSDEKAERTINITATEDGTAYKYSPTAEMGNCVYVTNQLNYTNPSYERRSMLRFNLTNLRFNDSFNFVTNGKLRLYMNAEYINARYESYYIGTHLAYGNYSWTEGNYGCSYLSGTCTGNEFCWNTLPTESDYNTTTESATLMYDAMPIAYYYWNIDRMLEKALNDNYSNISIYLIAENGWVASGSNRNVQFRSSEQTIKNETPQLNFTYYAYNNQMDIVNVSIANDADELFFYMKTVGNINLSSSFSGYPINHRVYINNGSNLGTNTTPDGNYTLPFKYDYYLEECAENISCLYNSTPINILNGTVNATGNELEMSINFVNAGWKALSTLNVTFAIESASPYRDFKEFRYDIAPNLNSFINYKILEGATAPVLTLTFNDMVIVEDNYNATNLSLYTTDSDTALIDINYSCTFNNESVIIVNDNTTKIMNVSSVANFFTSSKILVTCTAIDPQQYTGYDTFYLNFTSVNDAPTINLTNLTYYKFAEDTFNDSLNLSLYSYDIESPLINLNYSTTTNNTNVTIVGTYLNATKILNISSCCNFSGIVNVSVTVYDDEKNTSLSSFLVNITPVNDPPYLISEIANRTIIEENYTVFNLSEYFIDIDSVIQSLSYSDKHPNITASLVSTGIWNITPNKNYYGNTYIKFFAWDGQYYTYSNNVSIYVSNVNDVPNITQVKPTNKQILTNALVNHTCSATDAYGEDLDNITFYLDIGNWTNTSAETSNQFYRPVTTNGTWTSASNAYDNNYNDTATYANPTNNDEYASFVYDIGDNITSGTIFVTGNITGGFSLDDVSLYNFATGLWDIWFYLPEKVSLNYKHIDKTKYINSTGGIIFRTRNMGDVSATYGTARIYDTYFLTDGNIYTFKGKTNPGGYYNATYHANEVAQCFDDTTNPYCDGQTRTQFSTANYNAIGDINTTSVATTGSGSASRYTGHVFHIPITETLANLKSFTVYYSGHKQGAGNLFLWNATGSKWRNIGQLPTTTTAQIYYDTNNVTDFVDADSRVHILAESLSITTTYDTETDYVALIVDGSYPLFERNTANASMEVRGNDNWSNWTYTMPIGEHNYYCTAGDINGSIANGSLYTYTIDTSPPTVSILFPRNGTNTTDMTPNIYFMVYDENIINYTYRIFVNDTLSDTSGTNTTEQYVLTYISPALSVNNTYLIRVEACDNGNLCANSSPVVLRTKPPSLSLMFPSKGDYLNYQTVGFLFKANYDGVATVDCDLYIDSVYKNSNDTTNPNILTQINALGVAEGQRTYSINCSDGTSPTIDSDYFFVDLTAPLTTNLSPSNGASYTNSQTITYSYNVSDTYTVENCKLRINSTINQTDTTITKDTTQTFTIDNHKYGYWVWNVTCMDTATNNGTSSTNGYWVYSVPVVEFGDLVVNVSEDSYNTTNLSKFVTDPDSNDINWSCTTANSSISQTLSNTTKIINITAATNFYGLVNITCIGKDEVNLTSTDSFIVNVTSVNDIPIINVSNITYMQLKEDSYNDTINLSYYSYDVETANIDLNYSVTSNNSNVSIITSNTTKILNVTALNNLSNVIVNISITIYDSDRATAISSFLVNISNVNDAPYFNHTLTGVSCAAYTQCYYDVNAADVEGDTITYADNASLFIINPTTGEIDITPTQAQVGNNYVQINISDYANYTLGYLWVNVTACADNDADGDCDVTDCVDDDPNTYSIYADDISVTGDLFVCPGTYNINDTNQNGVLHLDANDITVECGGSVTMTSSLGGIAIISSSSGITVSDCIINGYDTGVYLQNADKSIVTANTLGTTKGVEAYNSDNITIDNNIISLRGGTHGISMSSCNNASVYNNEMNYYIYGLYLEFSNENKFHDNFYDYDNYSLYLSTTSSNIFYSESFADPGYSNVYTSSSTDDKIYNSTFEGLYNIIYDVNSSSVSNLHLINCNINESRLVAYDDSLIYRDWYRYFTVRNISNNALLDAVNLSINDTFANNLFNIYTTNGLTPQIEMTKYTKNSTDFTHWVNYTVFLSKPLYNNKTVNFNFSSNGNITIYMTQTNNVPSISVSNPATGYHDRTNLSVTYTPTDGDGNSMNCSLYINTSIGYAVNSTNISLISGTQYVITSINMTTEGVYSWFLNCTDGMDYTTTTPATYILDFTYPVLAFYNPSVYNTSFGRTNLSQNVSATDTYLYRCNISWYNDSAMTVRLYNNTYDNIADTTIWMYDNITFNQTGRKYGEYSCTDDHTATNTSLKKGKKGQTTLVFNESGGVSLEVTAYFVEKSEKPTDTPGDFDTDANLTSDKSKWKFYFHFTPIKPETKLRLNLTTYGTKLVNRQNISGILGHFVWGNSFTDFADLPNNMTYTLINQTETNAIIEIRGSPDWAVNNLVSIDPVTGGLNTITQVVSYYFDADNPTYTNLANNASTPIYNSSINWSITLQDNFNLSTYIFSYNLSVWYNDTPVAISGTSSYASVAKTINMTHNNTICGKFYFNDTSGNRNESALSCITMNNTAPVIGTPTINNTSPTVNSSILCQNGSYFDIDGDLKLNSYYRWYNNSRLLSNTTNNISLQSFLKTDVIICSWTADDGTVNGTWQNSSSVTILNSVPTVPTSAILNSSYRTNYTDENLTVFASGSSDADNDAITYNFNWLKNGTSLAVLNMPMTSNATGQTYDLSGFNNHGTVNGGAVLTDGIIGSGYLFDGTNDFINLGAARPLNLSNQSFSMTMWVKLNKTGKQCLISNNYDYTNDFGYAFFISTATKLSLFRGQNTSIIGTNTLVPNNWYFIALTTNETSLSFYINSSLDSSFAFNRRMARTTLKTMIAVQQDNQFFLNGTLDEIRIYNYTLSANEIAMMYNSGYSNYNSTHYDRTTKGDNFTVEVYPIDNNGQNGTKLLSNQLLIRDKTPYFTPNLVNRTANATYTFDYDINCTDDDSDTISYFDNTSLFDIVSTNGSIIDIPLESERGNYSINITCGDGNTNVSQIFTYAIYDVTPPVCTVISRIPADINDTSQGIFQVLLNCTDGSGINVTKTGNHYWAFVTRTLEEMVTPGLPNRWSIRPPANNIAQTDTLLASYGQIMRAMGRGEGYWYETLSTSSLSGDNNLSSWLQYDNYSYAVNDGDYFTINFTNTSATSATLNDTVQSVRFSAFRQNIPLSYESLVNENKKNITITKSLQLLVYKNDLEAMKGSKNYTLTVFRDVGTTSSPQVPTAVLRVFYCNSSYSPTGGVSVIASPNCVFTNSLTPAQLSTKVLTDRNSSYSQGFFSVTNGKIGGIGTTPYFYTYYDTLEANPNRAYHFAYANGSTNTNVSFSQTNRTWTSTNGGSNWTGFAGTPDLIYFTTKANNDEFQFGYCVYDLAGNLGCNKTVFIDDITATNHPISSPAIIEYNSSTGLDLNLSATHKGIMNIRIGCAKDPDSVGNVTHNLTLRNSDGSWNYTINSSFVCPNDAQTWVTFNTSLVSDFVYRMNLTATAGDNVEDIKTYLTYDNFTIDNTPPYVSILYPTANLNISSNSIALNGTASDNISSSITYYWIINNTLNSTTINSNSSLNASDGYYNLTLTVSDGYNNNSASVVFTLDTSAPTIDIIYPANSSYISSNNINLNASAYDSRVTSLIYYWLINGTLNSTTINSNSTFNASDGYYNLTLRVSDGLQNGSHTHYFTLDTIFPTWQNFTNNGSRRLYNERVAWSINVTSADFAPTFTFYFAHNMSSTMTNSSMSMSVYGYTSYTTIVVDTILNRTRGNYICGQFWLQDYTGNANTTEYSCFTVPNTVPAFIQNLTNQSIEYGDTLNYDVNCTDNDGDTITYFDNATLFNITSTNGSIIHYPALADVGNYTINITCGDTYDNITQQFNYEIKPSTIANISFINNTPNNETITVQLLQINISSSKNLVNAILDWNGTNISMTSQSATIWYYTNATMANGNYTFRVYGNDSLGVFGVSTDRWVYVDYTAPIIPPTQPPSGGGGTPSGTSPAKSNVSIGSIKFINLNQHATSYIHISDYNPMPTQKVKFTVFVENSTINDSVEFIYSTNGRRNFNKINMTYDIESKSHNTQLGGFDPQTIVEYYVIARRGLAINRTPESGYEFLVWDNPPLSDVQKGIVDMFEEAETAPCTTNTLIPRMLVKTPEMSAAIIFLFAISMLLVIFLKPSNSNSILRKIAMYFGVVICGVITIILLYYNQEFSCLSDLKKNIILIYVSILYCTLVSVYPIKAIFSK